VHARLYYKLHSNGFFAIANWLFTVFAGMYRHICLKNTSVQLVWLFSFSN